MAVGPWETRTQDRVKSSSNLLEVMPMKGQEERRKKMGRVPGCVLALRKIQSTQQGAPAP